MIPISSSPDLLSGLAGIVGRDRVRAGAPLASLTTFRIGGQADCLVDARDAGEIVRAVGIARHAGAPVTMLGGGSNVLVADEGLRGVVVRVHGGAIDFASPSLVRAGAGVTMNTLVRWMVGRGLRGLEAWAGTPGTVGGAIYGNAHFQGRSIGELVAGVRLLGPCGGVVEVDRAEMDFAYDRSRLQRTGEVVLDAMFRVEAAADPTALREVARASLAFRKRTQPLRLPSAGCTFQNPDPLLDRVPDGMPASAGALIDRAGLKGQVIGGARISGTHANFIVNEGGATAADVLALIALCQAEVRRRFGVELKLEIRLLGF